MSRLTLSVYLVLMLGQFAWGMPKSKPETPSEQICVGTSCLHLGMPQSEALAALSADYEVKKISDDKDDTGYLLVNKKDQSHVVLNLSATEGKLRYISKDWSPSQDSAPAMMDALYALAAHLAGDEKLPCTLETRTNAQPEEDIKGVFLTCGAKYIRMELITIKGEPGVQLQEVLQASDFGK